jgi:hypothetical protein
MSKEINDNYLHRVAKPADLSRPVSKYDQLILKKLLKLFFGFLLLITFVYIIVAAIKK